MIKKIIKTGLVLLFAVCTLDIGKHYVLKQQLHQLLIKNPEAVEYGSFSLKIWPLKSYLSMSDVKTKSGGTIENLTIRQTLFEFHKLILQGHNIAFKNLLKASSLKVKFAIQPDIYYIKDFLNAQLQCRHFILTDLIITLPQLTLTSPRFDSPWEYNLAEKVFKIAFRPAVLTLNNQISLSLNGKGDIQMIENYPDGTLLVNIKGFQKTIDFLKKNGTMTELQAGLLSFGTSLLSNNQSEIPLNLSIHNKTVSFGNFSLFTLN